MKWGDDRRTANFAENRACKQGNKAYATHDSGRSKYRLLFRLSEQMEWINEKGAKQTMDGQAAVPDLRLVDPAQRVLARLRQV